jgi:hypothetical protein
MISTEDDIPLVVTGHRVRVRSSRVQPRWLRKGTVEKINLEALVAYVRYSDLSAEWVEMERCELIQ